MATKFIKPIQKFGSVDAFFQFRREWMYRRTIRTYDMDRRHAANKPKHTVYVMSMIVFRQDRRERKHSV